MKSKNEIIDELNYHGISIVNDYYDEEFCSEAIKQIDSIIKMKSDKIYSNTQEGTAGDQAFILKLKIYQIEQNSSKTINSLTLF